MQTATWVIAGASVLNVIVLGAYAWFTWGIWRETQRSARRTEELARLSRDTLKLQVLAHQVESTEKLASQLASGDLPPKVCDLTMKHYGSLLQRAFPEQFTEIQRINQELLDEMLKAHGLKDQPPPEKPC